MINYQLRKLSVAINSFSKSMKGAKNYEATIIYGAIDDR